MSARLARYLPLLFALLLAGLIWVLDRAAELPAEQNKLDASLPDLIAQDAQVRRYGAEGLLVTKLEAKEARHLPQDDTMLFVAPRMEQTRKGMPKLTMISDEARAIHRAGEVWLMGKVEMHRASDGKNPELVIHTRDMHINTETQVARSQAPVYAEMGPNRASAVGFVADNRNETLELLSHVSMTYVPNKNTSGNSPRLLP